MLKGLLTISIDDPSSGNLKKAMNTMFNACNQGRARVNNGAEIRISMCNPENRQELYSIIGQVTSWSLNRPYLAEKPEKKKGFFRHLIEDDW